MTSFPSSPVGEPRAYFLRSPCPRLRLRKVAQEICSWFRIQRLALGKDVMGSSGGALRAKELYFARPVGEPRAFFLRSPCPRLRLRKVAREICPWFRIRRFAQGKMLGVHRVGRFAPRNYTLRGSFTRLRLRKIARLLGGCAPGKWTCGGLIWKLVCFHDKMLS